MILSILVTKKSLNQRGKVFLFYFVLSVFFFIFSRIYESLSYGEFSFFMHYLCIVPIIGGGILLAFLFFLPQLSRLSYNLWNSGVAVITTGFLLRGIINLSGRSTTLDAPYWMIGSGFLGLTLVTILWSLLKQKRIVEKT